MTKTKLPNGMKLSKDVNKKIFESEEYTHWTVEDLREMLEEFEPDTKVFVYRHKRFGKDEVKPFESFFGSINGIFIGY